MKATQADVEPEATRPSSARAESVLRRASSRILQAAGIPFLVFVVVVAAWQLGVTFFHVPSYLLPAPSSIWKSFGGQWGIMWHATRATADEAMIGYAIGNGSALLLAAAMAESGILERTVYPYAILLNSLPMAVIAPLLILLIGFSIWSIASVSALMCFFPTLVNGVGGFKATDATTLELMRGLNASRWKTFRYVKVPNALPFIFSALKISVALSLVGALVGEWISANQGLGFLTIQANQYVDTLLLFRAIIFVAALAIAGFLTVMALESYFLRWRR
jgi:NitT/TauT family transport system permease protein